MSKKQDDFNIGATLGGGGTIAALICMSNPIGLVAGTAAVLSSAFVGGAVGDCVGGAVRSCAAVPKEAVRQINQTAQTAQEAIREVAQPVRLTLQDTQTVSSNIAYVFTVMGDIVTLGATGVLFCASIYAYKEKDICSELFFSQPCQVLPGFFAAAGFLTCAKGVFDLGRHVCKRR